MNDRFPSATKRGENQKTSRKATALRYLTGVDRLLLSAGFIDSDLTLGHNVYLLNNKKEERL